MSALNDAEVGSWKFVDGVGKAEWARARAAAALLMSTGGLEYAKESQERGWKAARIINGLSAAMVFASNVLWLYYGLWVVSDSSIWVPNAFGSAVSALQLLVHAAFGLNLVQRGGVRVASL